MHVSPIYGLCHANVLSIGRPENDLQTVTSTPYQPFTNVSVSVSVEYVTDMASIYTTVIFLFVAGNQVIICWQSRAVQRHSCRLRVRPFHAAYQLNQ